LAPAGLHIGVLAVGKNGHEHFHRDHFPRIPLHNVQLLATEVYEQFLAGVVFEFHGALDLCILAPVVFQELRIAIRVLSRLHILLVMVQEGKSGMIPGLVDPLEVQHQLVIALVVHGGMGRKEYF
jgi:hypothetical protein